ncbi:hypothetical protein JYU03_00240 [bacterium AH-315-F03]|nr:hypothetical protein [bacterium AH-315-F03]
MMISRTISKIIPQYLLMMGICALVFGSMNPKTIARDTTDILAQSLSEVGFSRADLGYQPKGFWNRFPLEIPYKLGAFDDLFAEPLKLIDYSTVMANTVEKYLDPTYADSADNGLYKLVYHLGVDKKLGGFRDYSANLIEAPTGENPLGTVFIRLSEMAGRLTNAGTFGAKVESSDIAALVLRKVEVMPDTVQVIIARLLNNLADAIHWRNLAFRNCDPADIAKLFTINDLAQTQGDGQVYYSVFDDVEHTIDRPSLHYAALKTSAATEQAEFALRNLTNALPLDFIFEISTPFGVVAVFSKNYTGDSFSYNADNSLLIVDFGRAGRWRGAVGATHSPNNPISVMIDLGGDDVYGQTNASIGNLVKPSCGVGVAGVGVLLDAVGNDQYIGGNYAQGVGVFGVGVLLDRRGNDRYRAAESAQGCGYFGVGLCFDGSGNDTYYFYGDGQGMGGVGGGVGVLASFSGDNSYTAEPLAEVFNRADYHSKLKINANNAQGAGIGRRGDGSDGHSWAGGLGALIDIHGADKYLSGNFTLGIGYWFGTGIVVDRSGDDYFKSCYFTQGSGAHFCNGVLLDEGGDDIHELYETAGAGFGFGWDYTNAFFINKGGDDTYTAKIISYGLAQIRSNAFFWDIGGDDQYVFENGSPGFGEATFRAGYANPSQLTPYYYYAKSFASFIDIGGADTYYQLSDGKKVEHAFAKNNSRWLNPARKDSTYGANNFGVGVDIDSGTIFELLLWKR